MLKLMINNIFEIYERMIKSFLILKILSKNRFQIIKFLNL